MNEFINKVRKFEIKIRKAVNTRLEGDFNSIFKGSGLEFSDVREYQYGDDIRTIDWNVSAKGHGIFVKTFKEEKEQTVFFMLDVSGSQDLGKVGQHKLDIAKEVCAVLSLSAIKEGSQAGLFCFTDQKEKYLKPSKGQKSAYQIINSVQKLKPQSTKTDLSRSIFFALNILKRRSIVILVSDFIDTGYEFALRALAKRHDLILIHIFDNREQVFPPVGIVPLFDKELGKTVWVNTSSPAFQAKIKDDFRRNKLFLEDFSKKNSVSLVQIDTENDYLPTLIKLFKTRNRGRKLS